MIKKACEQVKANVFGSTIEVKKGNICEDENSGVKCPLNQGLVFTYKGTAKVPKNELLKIVSKFLSDNNKYVYYTIYLILRSEQLMFIGD